MSIKGKQGIHLGFGGIPEIPVGPKLARRELFIYNPRLAIQAVFRMPDNRDTTVAT